LRVEDMVTRKGENGKGYGVNQRVNVEGGSHQSVDARRRVRQVRIVVDAIYAGREHVWQAPPNAKVSLHLQADPVFGGGDKEENLMHDHQ
jgi:hypothetical protein